MEQNQTILDGIDPAIKDRLVSRRDAIRKGATASAMLTWGLSLGSVPVALAPEPVLAQECPGFRFLEGQFALEEVEVDGEPIEFRKREAWIGWSPSEGTLSWWHDEKTGCHFEKGDEDA